MEEQSRQRTSQAPSRGRGAGRGGGAPTQSPSRRPLRTRAGAGDGQPRDLTGPDPDPATFDPDTVAADDTAARPSEDTNQSKSPAEKVEADGAADGAGQEEKDAANGDAGAAKEEPENAAAAQPSTDVAAKLRRLDKLETKYHGTYVQYIMPHHKALT